MIKSKKEIRNDVREAFMEAYKDTQKKFPKFDKNQILFNAILKYYSNMELPGEETPLKSENKGEKLTND